MDGERRECKGGGKAVVPLILQNVLASRVGSRKCLGHQHTDHAIQHTTC